MNNGYDIIVSSAALRGQLYLTLKALVVVVVIISVVWAIETWRDRK